MIAYKKNVYFNKKYIEVTINDFTMYLIFPERLRRQKCREKRKAMRQKEVEAKEEIVFESVEVM